MMLKQQKIAITFPADRRASRTRRSQVVNEAPAEAQVQEQARLAAEGYRFYGRESREFAEANAKAVAEAWD